MQGARTFNRRRTRGERIAYARKMANYVLEHDDPNSVSYKALGRRFSVDPATVRNYFYLWISDVDRLPGLPEQERKNARTMALWMNSKTTKLEDRDMVAKLAIEILQDMEADNVYGVRSLTEIAGLLHVHYSSLIKWIESYEERHPETSFASTRKYRPNPDNGLKNAVALGDVDRINDIKESDAQRLMRALHIISERLSRATA